MSKPDLTKLFKLAEEHGKEGDPEHEVGDLQGFLITCWSCMTPEMRQRVYENHIGDFDEML